MPRRPKSEEEIAFDEHMENCKTCFFVNHGWRVFGLTAWKRMHPRRCDVGRAMLKALQPKWREETREARMARWKARHENSLQTLQSAEGRDARTTLHRS